MSDRDHEGVTTTVDQTSAERNGHGPSDRDRLGRSAYLVGVLARALTAQVEELGRSTPSTSDGWWFAEPDRPGAVSTSDGGTPSEGSASEAAEDSAAEDREEKR